LSISLCWESAGLGAEAHSFAEFGSEVNLTCVKLGKDGTHQFQHLQKLQCGHARQPDRNPDHDILHPLPAVGKLHALHGQ
jgi:hypothetical protein